MAESKTKKSNSILKRQRQTIKHNLRNKDIRSALRTDLKKFSAKLSDKVEAKDISYIHSVIDKARTKGILKKNSASRKKAIAAAAYAKHSQPKQPDTSTKSS
ncbi:MAG: 30S ribosomal protein S20 [SAR324 cluster bacterium]|nr:30S ribosomal protein S20 [SAR324 cluster bacterium]